MKRLFDLLISALGLLVLALPLLTLAWLVRRKLGSPVLFAQVRPGLHGKPFRMVKFRTMTNVCDASGALLPDAQRLASFGRFLRASSLDELPELWNVLRGEMSLVGPRPCLFNQEELIAERAMRGVFAARPGITGLAQVQAIDMSTPRLLAETDAQMLKTLTLAHYFRYILLTVSGKGAGDRIKGKAQ